VLLLRRFSDENMYFRNLFYARISTTFAYKNENFSDQQELQIVPNQFDHEDEPNVLTATPCLPTNKVPEINGDDKKEEASASSACSVPPHLLKGMLSFSILKHLLAMVT
jgi:hypothetical protein